MKLQVLQDNLGNTAGVFVPIQDWTLIKSHYPDIEFIEEDLQQWEKDIIDERLAAIKTDSTRLQPINKLLEELNRSI